MGLYAVLNENGKPIAYHENKRIVKEFLSDIKKPNHIVVKVKHPKNIEKTEEYMDLYLVRIGNQYIQSMYFDSADILSKEELISYESIIDLLIRELEYNSSISRSERKNLEKTLMFFQRRIEEINDYPYDYESCKRFHEIRQEMEYAKYDFNDIKNDVF